jgi:molybdopterin molybdotransferase
VGRRASVGGEIVIAFEDACALILDNAHPRGTIIRPLDEMLEYCLAEEVMAPFDLPSFDNSAVDGFAVRMADVESATPHSPVSLHLQGIIRAGERLEHDPGRGACLKIFTGASLPAWVEAVVMKEFAEEQEGLVAFKGSAQRGENIRRAGAEFRKGERVLQSGTRITPPVLGLLAALGIGQVRVYEPPRVALIVTGNELIAPGDELILGQIYDSNSCSLAAAIRSMGVSLVSVQRAHDDLVELMSYLASALEQADVLLTVGGASVGEFDFVKDALRKLGAHTHFTQVAMKPGKPTVFATIERKGARKLIFGLPGNPVSALVAFCVLVHPALLKSSGNRDTDMLQVSAILKTDLHKITDRHEFVRGRLMVDKGHSVVEPTTGQDSHMLGGLAQANGLIHFPAGECHLAAGRTVLVELLPWL